MAAQQKDWAVSWGKFLNPESLKGNLIAASLFLVAYETLKSSVIEQCRDFFTFGFDQDGPIIDAEYRNKVLSLDKNQLRACLLWLKEQGAISEDDLKLIDQIREHRNELAHNLPKFMIDADSEINFRLLKGIYELTTKIDRWWILGVELPVNPDFDGQEVDTKNITSGRMLLLQMMSEIVAGDKPNAYWEEFQRLSRRVR